MFDLFICHAPQDSEIATAIVDRLERDPLTRVKLGPTERLIEGWEEGQSSGALLLILSESSIPESLPRTDWEPLLGHAMGSNARRVGCLLAGDCPYPRLLDRKNFFRWNEDSRALRAIERWVLSLNEQPLPHSFAPARSPWFQGYERELDWLWEKLVDGSGIVLVNSPNSGSGNTSLAQHFARQAIGHFHVVLWVDCNDRSEAAVLGDLAAQLGIVPDGPLDELRSKVQNALGRARLLLVMDNVHPDTFRLTAAGCASVLLTSQLEEFDCEALALLNRSPVSACEAPAEGDEMRLWQAMSVCRPSGFPLELAAAVARIGDAESSRACERLVAARYVHPLDEVAHIYRLDRASALAASAAAEDLGTLRQHHASLLEGKLAGWKFGSRDSIPESANVWLAEALHAFEWANKAAWPQAVRLGLAAFVILRNLGRATEALELLQKLAHYAEYRADASVYSTCSREISWLRPDLKVHQYASPEDQLKFDFTSGWHTRR